MLSLAADQIALGLRRDHLRQDAMTAEVARRSDALKSALLDSVSHDLRTPLASIRATAGNLADPAVDWSPDGVRRAADTIDQEAQRLDRLVGSVLDLSRIESGALQPDLEVHDAAELIERALARLRHDLGRRPVTVDMATDLPLILVDAVLFDAIVSNILDNVVRPHAGRTRRCGHLGATIRRRRHRRHDRGRRPGRGGRRPGPDLRQVPADAAARRGRPARDGRRALDRARDGRRDRRDGHGPSLRARGPGVSLELPAAPAPPDDDVEPMTTPGAVVLIVEDDDATRRSVAANLSAHGFRVAEAADVRSAMRSLESARPDLILLDLGLPDDDGLVIIRRVRRDATTPILVLSARDAEPDKVTALESGADDYLTKPFGLAELRARIGALLRRAGGPAADPGGRIVLGPVVIDVARRSVQVGSNPVELTPREYELLKTMFSAAGPPAHARPAAARGLGRRLRDRGALPPRLRQPDPAQAGRGRPDRHGERPDRGRARRRLSDRGGGRAGELSAC